MAGLNLPGDTRWARPWSGSLSGREYWLGSPLTTGVLKLFHLRYDMHGDSSRKKSNENSSFSASFRSVLKAKGLKQTDVAHAIDEKVQTVNKWFTGASVPSIQQLIKMADYLNVSLDKLVGRTPRAAAVLLEARRELGSLLASVGSMLPDDPGAQRAPKRASKGRGPGDKRRRPPA